MFLPRAVEFERVGASLCGAAEARNTWAPFPAKGPFSKRIWALSGPKGRSNEAPGRLLLDNEPSSGGLAPLPWDALR
jgi:hypothetical protein